LDLGAGSGLAGIAAVKAGAARVLAADTDPFALAAITLNAAVNSVVVAATNQDLLAAAPARYDLILVGDLFYERLLSERVLAFLEAAHSQGAAVLVGDPCRSYFPMERFIQVVEYSVPVTRDLEDMEIKRTAVWSLA
jgi:predicted nicotinamide N-methyase